jgi:hypothetical protein
VNSHVSVRIAVDLRYDDNRKRKESPMKTTDSHELTDDEKVLASVLLTWLATAHNVEMNANQVREKHKDEQIASDLEMTAARAYESARDVIVLAPEKVRKAVEELFDAALEGERLKGKPPESLH